MHVTRKNLLLTLTLEFYRAASSSYILFSGESSTRATRARLFSVIIAHNLSLFYVYTSIYIYASPPIPTASLHSSFHQQTLEHHALSNANFIIRVTRGALCAFAIWVCFFEPKDKALTLFTFIFLIRIREYISLVTNSIVSLFYVAPDYVYIYIYNSSFI